MNADDIERIRSFASQPDLRQLFGLISNSDIPLFETNSGGPTQIATANTILCANQVFPLLADLIKITAEPCKPIPIAEFPGSDTPRALSAQQSLRDLFTKFGSDKARNGYERVYGTILQSPDQITDMLEIGLGTNNEDVASNMGANGKPGASVRSFGEFMPNANIFGADFDKRILFQEKNIKTYFVDQTDMQTLNALASTIGKKLDFIIDDGLHSANANIATVIFAISQLKDGGWYVCEDIRDVQVPLWQVVSHLLPKNFSSWIVEYTPGGIMFVAQKHPG